MSVILKTASNLFQRYNHLLITHPLKTKIITAGTISIFGDTFCQKVIEKKTWEEYSPKRTLRQLSVVCFIFAPFAHVWYARFLPPMTNWIKFKPAKIVASVILDNTLYGGLMLGSGVFTLELLKSWDLDFSLQNVQTKFPIMYENAIKFWGTVSLINHTMMPLMYRGVFTNACGVFWQVYISYMVNNKVVVPSSGTVSLPI